MKTQKVGALVKGKLVQNRHLRRLTLENLTSSVANAVEFGVINPEDVATVLNNAFIHGDIVPEWNQEKLSIFYDVLEDLSSVCRMQLPVVKHRSPGKRNQKK